MLSTAVHFAGKCNIRVKLPFSQCAVLSGDHTLWEGSWELCVCPGTGPGLGLVAEVLLVLQKVASKGS